VPNVLETPSPNVTFSRLVEVYGSAAGPSDDFTRLASATLTTHAKRGMVTELTVHAKVPVRWVRLRLAGGIQVMTPQSYFEFSEIVGNGIPGDTGAVDQFQGVWKGRGVLIELQQDGPSRFGLLRSRWPVERNGYRHGSIQITVDTYGHLIPGANRRAVDRLDDASPM
jgi:hypothetical protein